MELKRGILRSFDSGTYTATVEIAGSLGSWLDGIAVARNIDYAELIAGRKVGVLFFDSANPNDAVLFAVWA